jgi:hypothetical protein
MLVFKQLFIFLKHAVPLQFSEFKKKSSIMNPSLGYAVLRLLTIEGKSAAIFCCQVAAWVPGMFCNFYLVKNHKIAKNSTTTKAREKISTYPKSVRIFLMCVWLKFKNNLNSLSEISHRFLLTTKLFTG